MSVPSVPGQRFFFAALLWLVFVLMIAGGLVLGLLAIVALQFNYTARNCKAADRAAAASVPGTGWDDSMTISKRCGLPEWRDCTFCRAIRPIVCWMLEDPEHFEREAGAVSPK